MDYRKVLKADHAAKLEMCLTEVADAVKLRGYEIIWGNDQLNLVSNGVVCTGFDFSCNPLTGKITAELKKPQDLSPLFN